MRNLTAIQKEIIDYLIAHNGIEQNIRIPFTMQEWVIIGAALNAAKVMCGNTDIPEEYLNESLKGI